MKGTTNAQRNAVVGSSSAVDKLTLTMADGTTQQHTVSNIIPKDDAPTSGSSKFVTSGAVYAALDGKVSVESGKGLSTNDYTTAEKSKVANLPANANTTFATKTELSDALSSVYVYRGSVNTYANLPSNASTGDVYNVVASHEGVPAGTNWAWNGETWDALGGTVTGYVADTTTVNGKPLSSNVTLTAADVSAVPTTRTVNGKALSSDITLAASDVGALASGGTAARATADASGNVITSTYATQSALETGLAGKQNNLTFDSAPTSGSSNPVTSGGVYSAINEINVRTPTSDGSAGQVWTSDGNGVGAWKTPVGDSSKPIEIFDSYTINSTGKYTILAIGGQGGNGGFGGKSGWSRDFQGGQGGYGGKGYISVRIFDLSIGDIISVSLGSEGNTGSNGENKEYGNYSRGGNGDSGSRGGDTTVNKNGTLILTANGGQGGTGGKCAEPGGPGAGGNGGDGSLGGMGGQGGYDGSGGFGTDGTAGKTYSPNAESSASSSTRNPVSSWSQPYSVFGESFTSLGKLLKYNGVGRVFIMNSDVIFPL